ncbi:MAG: hypothetical protein ACTSR5_11410 [Promethearchaeota archaeon]
MKVEVLGLVLVVEVVVHMKVEVLGLVLVVEVVGWCWLWRWWCI